MADTSVRLLCVFVALGMSTPADVKAALTLQRVARGRAVHPEPDALPLVRLVTQLAEDDVSSDEAALFPPPLRDRPRQVEDDFYYVLYVL